MENADPCTILIAEDDDDTREILSMVLRAQGYAVVEAEDGARAFKLMEKVSPALVITDLRMPNKDGIAFAREAKQDCLRSAVPFILLSATPPGPSMPLPEFAAVFSKPVSLAELSACIKRLIG